MSLRLLAAVGLMVLIGGGSAAAQTSTKVEPAEIERIRRSNAQCLDCHSAAGLHALARPDVDKADLADRLVDPEAFLKSNHANVECVACHVTGFKEFPHAKAAKQQINNCDECHARTFLRIEDQLRGDAKKAKEQPAPSTCSPATTPTSSSSLAFQHLPGGPPGHASACNARLGRALRPTQQGRPPRP